jgi:hypothetical protein
MTRRNILLSAPTNITEDETGFMWELDTFGSTLEELTTNATVVLVDNDGGYTGDTLLLYEAPAKVESRCAEMIAEAFKKANS